MRILVTGASQGIGRATVEELARRGHDVVATARNAGALADLPARALTLDVSDTATVKAAVAAAGPLDAVFANAGQTVRGSVLATPEEEFARLFDLNTLGALRVVQAVLPQWLGPDTPNGRLVFTSSIIGRLGSPGGGAYAATKWALEGLAETIALEHAADGVQVSLIQPGRVGTTGPRSAPVYDAPAGARPATGMAGSVLTAPEVATAVADELERPRMRLRVPVGKPAEQVLAARRAAPDDEPFSWT